MDNIKRVALLNKCIEHNIYAIDYKGIDYTFKNISMSISERVLWGVILVD